MGPQLENLGLMCRQRAGSVGGWAWLLCWENLVPGTSSPLQCMTVLGILAASRMRCWVLLSRSHRRKSSSAMEPPSCCLLGVDEALIWCWVHTAAERFQVVAGYVLC